MPQKRENVAVVIFVILTSWRLCAHMKLGRRRTPCHPLLSDHRVDDLVARYEILSITAGCAPGLQPNRQPASPAPRIRPPSAGFQLHSALDHIPNPTQTQNPEKPTNDGAPTVPLHLDGEKCRTAREIYPTDGRRALIGLLTATPKRRRWPPRCGCTCSR